MGIITEAMKAETDAKNIVGLWRLNPDTENCASRQNINVLVIEDNPLDFKIIRRALSSMDLLNAKVFHADNIIAARELADENRIDIALVDYYLGVDSGIRAIHEIGGRCGDCPVIMVTGMPGQDIPRIALDAGAINHLSKNDLTSILLETTIRSSLYTHRVEMRLKDTILELERANRNRDNFFSRMSHDLKTPLNAIIGYSGALSLGAFGEGGTGKYKEGAQIISKAGNHLLEVINSLIIQASSDARDNEPTISVKNVREVISDAISLVSFHANVSDHEISLDIKHKDILIDCQAPILTQAITNLLSNAIKYSAAGTKISVSAARLDEYVEIQIKDNGIGMSEKELEVALLPFGRVDLPGHVAREGSGVGLSIVQEIVETHAGAFDITSTPGEGTTAIIRLPYAKSALTAA